MGSWCPQPWKLAQIKRRDQGSPHFYLHTSASGRSDARRKAGNRKSWKQISTGGCFLPGRSPGSIIFPLHQPAPVVDSVFLPMPGAVTPGIVIPRNGHPWEQSPPGRVTPRKSSPGSVIPRYSHPQYSHPQVQSPPDIVTPRKRPPGIATLRNSPPQEESPSGRVPPRYSFHFSCSSSHLCFSASCPSSASHRCNR